MELLGPIASRIEIMRVDPWTWSDPNYVVYDVHFVLSMYSQDQKLEIKAHIDFGRRIKEIEKDPEQIAAFLCEKALIHILPAIRGHSAKIRSQADAWSKLLPTSTE